MTPRDNLSALVVALIWGLTFIAIKFGVQETTPLLLTALRFAFAAFPAVLFVKPPKASFRLTTLYGLFIGVGQFGLLLPAIRMGIPVGLVSLLVQLQVFVTIFLAWAWLGERPGSVQLISAGVALLGIVIIGTERLHGASLVPFLMVIAAAFCWGLGNVLGKLAGRIDMLAFVVWSSLAAPLPLLALSFWLEGPDAFVGLLHPSWMLVICVATLAYGGTLIGYGVWSRLLGLYSAAVVAPFALLVPVVGMIGGSIIFGEPLTAIELIGSALVMAGLTFNVFGDRLMRWRARLSNPAA
jgi:O-acetylserine/cysteine efflux transporter